MTSSSTSIIIPVYNNIARLEKCLNSLVNQNIPREAYEIIVVDNESTDGSYELAKRFADKVLMQDKMKSPYPSRNMGIRASKGYYKILLDSNVTVPEHFLEVGTRQLEENNSDFGAPPIKFEVDENSTTWELLDSLVYVDIENSIKQGGVTAGCVFTKNNFFSRFGYFDESLRSNGDSVWSKNATAKGAKLVLLENLEVNYPPKDKHLLLKKGRRIGFGNRSVWIKKGENNLIIFLKALWNMRPSSMNYINEKIARRGRKDLRYPRLKLWYYNWILKIAIGIGRLGL